MDNFNLNWEFFSYNILNDKNSIHGELINLPHTNKILPIQYYNEKDFQFISSYKKIINVKFEKNKHYILNFEGIMMKATLYVNKKYVATSVLGFLDFKNDITSFLVDGDNEIVVIVDSQESVNSTPFGGLIDYVTFGGIYREAQFTIKNETYIENVKATYLNNSLTIELFTNTHNFSNVDVYINEKRYSFNANNENKYIIQDLQNIILWNIDNPHLYKITVKIDDDEYSFNYGFRTIELKDNLISINGKTIKIMGLNRHQSFPYIGYAATKNMQVIDAKILKDLGVNLVRTSHYPQSRHFLDACDKLGLLVLEEIPGWQYLGNDEWKETVKENTKQMILRDYNHPSIIIFGVRVNESEDCDNLYKETNRIAHELDKTRFTGGIRCIKNSKMYEDIYTYNDFSFTEEQYIENPLNVTGLDHDVPYLITEFAGHTYPTKKIDNEERQMVHLLRHAKVHHAAFKASNIIGSIAWCAFDYNTHHQFGSGDKICYHGVMDIFRMPKLASKFYKGQIDRKEKLVLEVATIFAFGERNYGGIVPLYVFSNCDEVIMKVEGKNDRHFKIDENFSSFKNPIFRLDSMDGVWGGEWKDATIVGLINKKEVIAKKFLADQLPVDIDVKLYDKIIENNDSTRIEVRIVDRNNDTLRFDNSVLNISVENAILQGPNTVALYGGEYAFYVRANKKGTIKIKLNCQNFEKEISLEVE